MPDVRKHWQHGRLSAALYDRGIENERSACLLGRLMWSTDTRRFFDEVLDLTLAPDGAAVLDIPCGGGVAFRGIGERQVRYVAADLSPYMLSRAREEARRRGLERRIEFTEADVEALPFEDGGFDLCQTFNSIHCFPDPAAGLAEIARVAKPGGIVRGTTAITGVGRRHDALIRFYQRAGAFGPGGSLADLKGWLDEAGLEIELLEQSGAIAYFRARKPSSGD